MFWLFGKRKDRSYSVKLRRTSFAKLSLLAERLDCSETDAMEGAIDFAIASRGNTPQNTGGGLDIGSLISGGEGDSDILTTIIKAAGPQIVQKLLGPATSPGTTSPGEPGVSDADMAKKMRELGL